jgi:hypothetical protein
LRLDLIRGHGLDLDDLGLAVRADDVDDDAIGLVGVTRPVDFAAGGGAGGFELLQVGGQMPQNVVLGGARGIAQCCQSGVSATTLARRARIMPVAWRTLWRSWVFPSSSRMPGSPPDADSVHQPAVG